MIRYIDGEIVELTQQEIDALTTLQAAWANEVAFKVIDEAREKNRRVIVSYLGRGWDADTDALLMLAAAVTAHTAAPGTMPTSVSWWDAENLPVTLTRAELIGLFVAVQQQHETVTRAARSSKNDLIQGGQ